MKSKEHKVLSIAVASGKMGYVFMINGKLMDWGLSVNAVKTPGLAKCKAEEWISFYQPDIVLTEQVAKYSRKSRRTHKLVEAVSRAFTRRRHVSLERRQLYANKYDEMEALTEQFPQIVGWMPDKRQPEEAEVNDAIYFEALSMALQLQEPPTNLPI